MIVSEVITTAMFAKDVVLFVTVHCAGLFLLINLMNLL